MNWISSESLHPAQVTANRVYARAVRKYGSILPYPDWVQNFPLDRLVAEGLLTRAELNRIHANVDHIHVFWASLRVAEDEEQRVCASQ